MEDFATNYRAPMIASLGPFGGRLVMAVPKPAAAVYHGEVREKSLPCLGHSRPCVLLCCRFDELCERSWQAGFFNWIAEFPSVQQAHDWHESDAYKAILECRDKNSPRPSTTARPSTS